MRIYAFIFVTFLFLPFPLQSWGGNSSKGQDAFRKGDYETALKELTPLAERGNSEAQLSLGYIYYWGLGTTQNYKKALKWYTLSAQQGQPEAQYALGNIRGLIDDKIIDFIDTHMWWNLASSNGSKEALNGLRMIEKAMSRFEIEKALELAKKCVLNNYRDC